MEPRASLEPRSFLLRAWWDYCRPAFSPCNVEKVNALLSVTPFLSLLGSASPPIWKAEFHLSVKGKLPLGERLTVYT